jgi:hypothetical protein
MKEPEEFLQVQWVNFGKDYDIHFKRFKRMGALMEWVEKNPDMTVMLKIYSPGKKGEGTEEKYSCKTKGCP